MASEDDEMETNKEEVDDDDDDDDSDTSSDTDEEEIDDSVQEAELIKLRDAVQSNLYNYQPHIDYITLARQYANLEHLRLARQTMSNIFPLTEQLWLDWLSDEKLLLTSTTEKNEALIQLFERAVNDYLSVKVWIEYIQYRFSVELAMNSIEELRNLCERALSACALHLSDGSLVWAAYIATEQAKLMGIVASYNKNNTNNDIKEKVLQHVDFILTLYRRQLSIPLREMESIYNEYNEFCQQYKEYLPSNYTEQFDIMLKRDFDHAIQRLAECEKFEQELDNTGRSVVTYRKYIQSEKEPAHIQCLYERAIVDNCLDVDLWLSYIDFAEKYLSTSTALQSIFERSLRNCPWVATLWIRYAEYMEFGSLADHSQLKLIYDRALNSDPTNLISFVDLQLAYFQYRRRHYHQQSLLLNNTDQCEILKEEIRHACEYACDQYQELFLTSNDPKLFLKYNGQLELFWIHLEIKSFHSIDHGRQIWNGRTLMNKTHNQMISNLWKNYYYMEIHYGDDKHARKVLYRALNHIQTMDFPLIICDLLLEHETKYGTIQQLKESKEKLNEVKTKLIKYGKPKRQQKEQQANKKQIPKEKQKEKSKKVPNQKMDTTAPPTHTNGNGTDQQQQSSPRKRKLSPEETQTVKKKPAAPTVDSEGFKIPAPPPPALAATSAASSSTTPIPTNTKNIDHLNTVFIANLAYDVSEDAIREALSPAGPIKEIRIVKHEWSNKSKGFGYADFVTADSCRQALKLDHTLINGRPMYVSPYDPNKSVSNDITKKFKYATSLEQNKLFLSSLPFTATKEQIQNLFTQHGYKIKDVRLVTHKSGRSKGLAYAEFENPQDASQAVLKVDGTEMDGHTIKVAISNPPQRKEQTKTPSLGEAPKPVGPRGRGHSQISLVPRKLAMSSTIPKSESTTTTTTTTNSMSNDDFSKTFFSKK